MMAQPTMALWFLLMLLALDRILSKAINTFAGPFIAFGHQFAPCESDGTAVIAMRASHFNRARPYDLQTISANITVRHMDVGDNLWSSADLATWANNQWKENAFLFKFPRAGCSAIREHIPDMFRIIAKHSGSSMDSKEPCIIPQNKRCSIFIRYSCAQGHYVMSNEPVNWTFPHFPIMPYGRYRFRLRTRSSPRSSIYRFCLQVDCEIIPKP